ncbi:hypothetical protein [Niallia endozanthoxylica]|uniref:hypothetical protein n=1 Tax=Niallia endozanthoxylica TaxID=2036016 RepID=UPI00168BF095|nr:hypothetical protein [Niallia endozanthoxylica]
MSTCKVCNKELKDTDWIKLDYRNRLTHCTCDNLRSDLKDLDTFKNLKNKYSLQLKAAK